ncbi:MAG: C4-dicarboxylate ABC transporter [Acidobacteria bacterium]|nr:MAG: C4-dicarboxylate ABC transporter [Acidobacteriota bacterium]
MSLPVLSIMALVVAIVISCVSRFNVGLLSIAFAFLVGVVFGKMSVAEVMAGFPSGLFLTLIGVMFFFSQATVNGTLDKLTQSSLKLARGRVGMIPVIFFFISLVFSSIGPGAIATVAFLAPVAMNLAGRVGISGFLMAIVLCSGANAGTLSPIAPSGVIANNLMARIHITGQESAIYLNNLYIESIVGLGGYFILGGYQLLTRPPAKGINEENAFLLGRAEPMMWNQKLTVALIALLIAAVVLLKIDVAMGAFVAAAVLTLTRASEEQAAMKALPWNVIVMVCGVIVLISILEKKGGLDLFITGLAKFATKTSVNGVIAFVAGLISVYSSSAGVVMPAFIPTIPGLIAKLGGGDAIAIAGSISVGAMIVDTSPLSTTGALCIASAAASEDRRAIFNKMLAWGLSMSVVGALVCWVFFGLLSKAG